MSGSSRPIVHDSAPAALAAAVKGNRFALFEQMEDSAYSASGCHAWRSSVPYTWFNGIRTDRPAEAVADAGSDALLNLFAGHDGAISWWLGPGVPVEPWRARLNPRGLSYWAAMPGMAVALPQPSAATAPPVTGLEIRLMGYAAELRGWSELFVAGYGLLAGWLEGVYKLTCVWGCDLPFRHFLGVLDGEPVATSSLLLGGGVAGVHNVAVVPAARGRGIGAAMTKVVLAHGYDLGYRIGVLQASEQGYPLYRCMGFAEVCKVDLFTKPAPAV